MPSEIEYRETLHAVLTVVRLADGLGGSGCDDALYRKTIAEAEALLARPFTIVCGEAVIGVTIGPDSARRGGKGSRLY